MEKTKTLIGFIAASLLCLLIGLSPASAAYVLANSNGGDGYVTTTPSGFDLFGANNGASFSGGTNANYTTYTQVAATNTLLNFSYTYTTSDCCGAQWDPAGYVLNGSNVQLSPATSASNYSGSGLFQLNVLAGETYGFYVYSQDSVLGRGDIAISEVPLPASLLLFCLGLIGLALFGFSRQKYGHNV